MITKTELMQRICEIDISHDMLWEELTKLEKQIKKLDKRLKELEPAKEKKVKNAKVSK